jgi:hypothetical protein
MDVGSFYGCVRATLNSTGSAAHTVTRLQVGRKSDAGGMWMIVEKARVNEYDRQVVFVLSNPCIIIGYK